MKSRLGKNKIDFLLFASKRHDAVSRIELFVKRTKDVFNATGMYAFLKAGNFSLNQLLLILSNTETIINSRPIIINSYGAIITPLTLESFMDQSPHLLNLSPADSSGLEHIVKVLHSAIFEKIFIQNILDTRRNFMQKSPGGVNTGVIKVGGVVFDPYTYIKTKNYATSLYKVVFVSPTKTSCTIKKPRCQMTLQTHYKRYSKLKTDEEKLKFAVDNSIFLSRPLKNLVYIADISSKETYSFEPPFLQEFGQVKRIEEYLAEKQSLAYPTSFMTDIEEVEIHASLDLFRHLNPELTIPRLKKSNNTRFENLNDLTPSDIDRLMQEAFKAEVNDEDIQNAKQFSELAQSIPSIIPNKEANIENEIKIQQPEPELDDQQLALEKENHPTEEMIQSYDSENPRRSKRAKRTVPKYN